MLNLPTSRRFNSQMRCRSRVVHDERLPIRVAYNARPVATHHGLDRTIDIGCVDTRVYATKLAFFDVVTDSARVDLICKEDFRCWGILHLPGCVTDNAEKNVT